MRTSLFAVAAVLLFSCAGPDGKAYQSYSWYESLDYIYDTNPSTPYTIYNGDSFATDAGDFYMEYEVFDGYAYYAYYAYYTITVEKGKPLLQAGDDSWFDIELTSYGPTMYSYTTSAKHLKSAAAPSVSRTAVPTLAPRADVRGPVLGNQVLQLPSATVTLRYGKFEPTGSTLPGDTPAR